MTFHPVAIISKGQCPRCPYYGLLAIYEEGGTWGQIVVCGDCATKLFGQERKDSDGTAELQKTRESK